MQSNNSKLDIIRYWCVEARIIVRKDSGHYYMRLEYYSAVVGDYVIRTTVDYRQIADALDDAYNMVNINAWNACT